MKIFVLIPPRSIGVRDVALGFYNAFYNLDYQTICYESDKIYRFFETNDPGAGKMFEKEFGGTSREVYCRLALAGFYDFALSGFGGEAADFILVIDGREVPWDKIKICQRYGIKVGLFLTDEPYDFHHTVELSKQYDIVFSNDLATIDLHKKHGNPNIHYLPTAFDEVHREFYGAKKKKYDISFVGALMKTRTDTLDAISDTLEKHKFFIQGISSELLPEKHRANSESWTEKRLIECGSKALSIREVTEMFNYSKIVLNIHREPEWGGNDGSKFPIISALSPNPRTFEAAACGAFQLVDDQRPEIRRMFNENEMVEYEYGNPKDLSDKIEYYLKNQEEAKQISRRAYKRVWKEHTYTNRAKTMLELLKSSFGSDFIKKRP